MAIAEDYRMFVLLHKATAGVFEIVGQPSPRLASQVVGTMYDRSTRTLPARTRGDTRFPETFDNRPLAKHTLGRFLGKPIRIRNLLLSGIP